MTEKTISRLKRWGLMLLIVGVGAVTKCINKDRENSERVIEKMKNIQFECKTCNGCGQVDYYDDYGNYTGSGACPKCHGRGKIQML